MNAKGAAKKSSTEAEHSESDGDDDYWLLPFLQQLQQVFVRGEHWQKV